MDRKFDIGRLVFTRAVYDRCRADEAFLQFTIASLMKYIEGDWGDTCEEDRVQNDFSLENGERILAVYKRADHGKDTIWIITEWDRSATTILFPEDY